MSSILLENKKGFEALLMGNDAISRGALEAGVSVVTGYPGTPSSEIVEQLAKVAHARNLYVEWSVNEKVAMSTAFVGPWCWYPARIPGRFQAQMKGIQGPMPK